MATIRGMGNHMFDPDSPTLALCGGGERGDPVMRDGTKVTCGGCLRRMADAEHISAQNRAMAKWLPQTPKEPIDWNTVGVALPSLTLRDLLPRLTPLQREAAITLATRCGEPRALRVGAATGAFEMAWCGTIAWAYEDGSVTGTTKVAHASIEAVELAVKGRSRCTCDDSCVCAYCHGK